MNLRRKEMVRDVFCLLECLFWPQIRPSAESVVVDHGFYLSWVVPLVAARFSGRTEWNEFTHGFRGVNLRTLDLCVEEEVSQCCVYIQEDNFEVINSARFSFPWKCGLIGKNCPDCVQAPWSICLHFSTTNFMSPLVYVMNAIKRVLFFYKCNMY